jgi:hypothetical protein
MQLLIQRGQGKSKLLKLPVFKLWARFEITADEAKLIDKYHVRGYTLVEGDPKEFKRAMLIAGVIAFIVFGMTMQPQYFLLTFAVGTFLIYHQIREQVQVGDILDGRFFACRSVVTLMAKEKAVTEMAYAFRHLLEAMKNWGGREIIELELYKAPSVKVVE